MKIKNNYTKKDIAKYISIKTGFSVNYAEKITNELINILNLLIKNGTLSLKNIGTFKLLNKKERIGRNPKTKETHIIAARKSISFLASKKISQILDQNK